MGESLAIGLSGYAGVGKTAAALYLEKQYGFKRLHIAEPMRAMLAVLMRANGIDDVMIDRYLTGDLKDGVPIPELGNRTSRELQISLGTEWGRTHVHEDIWASTWAFMAGGFPRVMNDSVRFPNEEDGIRAIDGFTILIERPGFGPAKFKHGFGKWLHGLTGSTYFAHPSERVDLLDPDYAVVNDSSISVLHSRLDYVMMDRGIRRIPVEADAPQITADGMRFG